MPGELAALVSLLDDDSPTVLAAVTQRLRELADEAAPALRDLAEQGSPKVRGRAREVLANLERREGFSRLARLAETPGPDLEEGAMLLASIHDPAVDPFALRLKLDRLAEGAARTIGDAPQGRPRIERFLKSLHQQEGFQGDEEAFYAFQNNFLDSVLERRRGIPITLILVYMLVGRRIGVDICAVGTPYRALAVYRDASFRSYVDAFAGGRLMSYHECSEMLQQSGFRGTTWQDFLRPVSDRQILERMVRNLVNFCASQGRDLDGRDFTRIAMALAAHRHLDLDGHDRKLEAN